MINSYIVVRYYSTGSKAFPQEFERKSAGKGDESNIVVSRRDVTNSRDRLNVQVTVMRAVKFLVYSILSEYNFRRKVFPRRKSLRTREEAP